MNPPQKDHTDKEEYGAKAYGKRYTNSLGIVHGVWVVKDGGVIR
jgi:isoprenylcysteine carboxyl methyltransferase (ICMT) family protein YpbQ